MGPGIKFSFLSYFQETLSRFTYIVAESVITKHEDSVHVIFLANREGVIKKLSFNPETGKEMSHILRQPAPLYESLLANLLTSFEMGI